MNDKEWDKWLETIRERWRPYRDWSDKLDLRIKRLEVRTKLTLARSAYLKAQAEMRAWQGVAAGRQGEIATRAAPDDRDESGRGGRRRRRAGRSAASH